MTSCERTSVTLASHTSLLQVTCKHLTLPRHSHLAPSAEPARLAPAGLVFYRCGGLRHLFLLALYQDTRLLSGRDRAEVSPQL